ncbi:Protein of unknown function [Gryllus bimaculatus]|nr:Protein of unknown function [Gryllus bimaculatus]
MDHSGKSRTEYYRNHAMITNKKNLLGCPEINKSILGLTQIPIYLNSFSGFNSRYNLPTYIITLTPIHALQPTESTNYINNGKYCE